MTIQCCQCRKVKQGREWVPVHADTLENVSHGYCPRCLADAEEQLRARIRASRKRPGHNRAAGSQAA